MVKKHRYHLLGAWARLVAHRPKIILLLALLLAGVSVVVTVCKLEFQPNRNDLISPKLPWNKVFIDWQNAFPGSRDLVVVVDSGPKTSSVRKNEKSSTQPLWENADLARKFISQLTPKLDVLPFTGQVISTLNTADFTPKAIRLAPWDTFNTQLDQIKQSQTLLFSASPSELLARTIVQIRQTATSDNPQADAGQKGLTHRIKQFDQLIQSYHQVLAGQRTTLPTLDQVSANMPVVQYLTSPNGRLYFIRITPLPEPGKLNAFESAINSIQYEIDSLLTQPDFNKNFGGGQGVEGNPGDPGDRNFRGWVGLTGIEVVEGQETAIATRDSTIASIIASILIAILLMLAFHSVRGPLLAMVALFIGIAWTFGILTITIGHLQVISVVFTIILLGLGIDFAVHLKSSFENIRHGFDDSEAGFSDALVQTFRVTGPGMLTGALTTAAAFMTTLLTDFTGVAEMGFIAGVGVLLCLFAMFTVYPALLRLVKPGHKHFKPMDDRKLHFFETRWVIPFARHPILTVVVTIGLTLFSSVYAYSRVQFDYDLLKLQPVNAPAMNWAKRIMTDGGESIYFGVSVCKDIQQARQRMTEFAKLPLVQPTFGGIGLLFPPDEQTKIDAITKLKDEFASVLNPKLITDSPATPQQIEQLQTQLQALQFAINGASLFNMPREFKHQIKAVGQSVRALNLAMFQWDSSSLPKRVGQLNQWFNGLQINVAQKVNRVLDPSPLTPADVPQELLRAYHDDAGRWTLEIYPKLAAGQSPLSPEFLPDFVAQIQQVDHKVTGVLMQIYQSGMLIRDAYVKAGVLALIIVFIIVLIDFRNVHDALLVLLPVVVGFSLTFAIMLWLGMQINPANIIVLPLMFGIGVDSGVHVLHRYRQHPEDDPPGLTQATGKGITMTTLTTVIGFACMMLAEHRGIRSLGFVVSLGLIMTLLACWTVMPAWLVLIQRFRSQRAK